MSRRQLVLLAVAVGIYLVFFRSSFGGYQGGDFGRGGAGRSF